MTSFKVIAQQQDSHYHILSPAVGLFSLHHDNSDFLSKGSYIGKLKILATYYDLFLPDHVYGQIKVESEQDKNKYVEYKQLLFSLNISSEYASTDSGTEIADSKTDAYEQSENSFILTAITSGVFYSRPSSDSPPYVEEGQTIEKGRVIGLIEIMKTFNQIVFQGTDTTSNGVIKKILVEDSQEVKWDQPLFVIDKKK